MPTTSGTVNAATDGLRLLEAADVTPPVHAAKIGMTVRRAAAFARLGRFKLLLATVAFRRVVSVRAPGDPRWPSRVLSMAGAERRRGALFCKIRLVFHSPRITLQLIGAPITKSTVAT
jgi:hypothetical protein